MRQALFLFVVFCAVLLDVTRGFVAPCSRSTSLRRDITTTTTSSTPILVSMALKKDDDDDIPQEEMIGSASYQSSVDWDAEWKKVVDDQKQGKAVERPGTGYYKSEAEIKAIQTANKAAREAAKVQASLPSWQMLKGDWKVRLCVLSVCFWFVDVFLGFENCNEAGTNALPF